MEEFQDARMLLDRARLHAAEFAKALGSVWSVSRVGNGYRLSLNRSSLNALKPVVGDAANNIVHSLDQALSACARLNRASRSRSLTFPMQVSEADFERNMALVTTVIGARFAQVLREVRSRHSVWLGHIRIVKELSNSSKHWQLVPATSSACAVGYSLPGKAQTIIDIPRGQFEQHDHFDFSVDVPHPKNMGFQTVIQFRIGGLGSDLKSDPSTAFDLAERYASDTINELERAA